MVSEPPLLLFPKVTGECDVPQSFFKKNLVPTDAKIKQKYDNFHCEKALRSPTVVQSCPVFITF